MYTFSYCENFSNLSRKVIYCYCHVYSACLKSTLHSSLSLVIRAAINYVKQHVPKMFMAKSCFSQYKLVELVNLESRKYKSFIYVLIFTLYDINSNLSLQAVHNSRSPQICLIKLGNY